MSNRATIIQDILAYCEIQELDPLKSNDFNKVLTFIKRQHPGQISCSDLVLSMNTLEVMSFSGKKEIRQNSDLYFDKMLVIILSYAIRITKYVMKEEVVMKPPFDPKTKILTVRGILNDVYEVIAEDALAEETNKKFEDTHFGKIVKAMQLSIEAQRHLCELLMGYSADRSNYQNLQSITYYWKVYKNTKRRGRETVIKSQTGIDQSYGALIYMATAYLPEMAFNPDQVITFHRWFRFKLRQLTSSASSPGDIWDNLTYDRFIRRLSNSLANSAKEAINLLRVQLPRDKNTIDELFVAALKTFRTTVHSQLAMRNYSTWSNDTDRESYHHIQLKLSQFVMVMGSGYEASEEMKSVFNDIASEPMGLDGRLVDSVAEISMKMAQKSGDTSRTLEWLRNTEETNQENICNVIERTFESVKDIPGEKLKFREQLVNLMRDKVYDIKSSGSSSHPTLKIIRNNAVLACIALNLGALINDYDYY